MKDKGIKFSSILYTLLGIIVVLGLGYGILANKVVTVGYDVESMEKKLNEMKDKNDELKIKVSELQSVKILENKVTEIGMIEPDSTEYITLRREVAFKK